MPTNQSIPAPNIISRGMPLTICTEGRILRVTNFPDAEAIKPEVAAC